MSPGEIHWVQLPPANGHEQAGRRPAIIVQDANYDQLLPTVLIVPLTGAVSASRFTGTVSIEPTSETGLRQRSVALVFQLRAIDRKRVQERIGSVSAKVLQTILSTLDRLTGRQPQ